jgi:hypothetical protein
MSEPKRIIGTRAIGTYLGRSIGSVMNYHRLQNLPIFKVGGIWEADSTDLDEWKKSQRENQWYEKQENKRKPRKKLEKVQKK